MTKDRKVVPNTANTCTLFSLSKEHQSVYTMAAIDLWYDRTRGVSSTSCRAGYPDYLDDKYSRSNTPSH